MSNGEGRKGKKNKDVPEVKEKRRIRHEYKNKETRTLLNQKSKDKSDRHWWVKSNGKQKKKSNSHFTNILSPSLVQKSLPSTEKLKEDETISP